MEVQLTQSEIKEMYRVKQYFPYRVISAVKTLDGHCEIFANTTAAKANNYARKNNATIFRLN